MIAKRSISLLVATLMAALSFGVIMSTNDMGYSRDESFYFQNAEIYQEWFDVLNSDKAFQREEILRIWKHNAEHPPLVKVLMGGFWRTFAQIERPVRAKPPTTNKPDIVTFTVQGLAPSHPFWKGTSVSVLGPQSIDQAAEDPRRHFGTGQVTKRGPRTATVEFKTSDPAGVMQRCTHDYRPGPQYMRGCSIRRDGPLLEGSAMRLVGPFFTALLIFAMVLFGWHQLHPVVGITAPLLFLTSPRWFYHAHLAAFDMPVTAMVFLISAAFWVSLERPRWAWATGVLWGIGLLTKHNALFLPIPFIAFWLLTYRREFSVKTRTMSRTRVVIAGIACLATLALGIRQPVWGVLLAIILFLTITRTRIRFPRIPLAFLVMPPIGLGILFVFWPKLWVDPFAAIESYLNFHLAHEHYLQYYLGQILEVPPFPFEYPFVLTALTVPVLTLVVCLFGGLDLFRPGIQRFIQMLRKTPRNPLTAINAHLFRLGIFLALLTLFPVVLIALPSTPVFGGVKHWMTGMPFLCILGGWGIWRISIVSIQLLALPSDQLRKQMSVVAAVIVSIAVLIPATLATATSTPVGNTYYNELAGGISGAADQKLTRIYWGYASKQTLDQINTRLPANATVWLHDTTTTAFQMYKREGRVRNDLNILGSGHVFARNCHDRSVGCGITHVLERADAALFEEQKFFGAAQLHLQRIFGTPGPSWAWRAEGVPMISLYEKDRTTTPTADEPKR